MIFQILGHIEFGRPLITLEEGDPWNVVIGLVAVVLFWRAINRTMDKPDPFNE
jgi:hypothetical protein